MLKEAFFAVAASRERTVICVTYNSAGDTADGRRRTPTGKHRYSQGSSVRPTGVHPRWTTGALKMQFLSIVPLCISLISMHCARLKHRHMARSAPPGVLRAAARNGQTLYYIRFLNPMHPMMPLRGGKSQNPAMAMRRLRCIAAAMTRGAAAAGEASDMETTTSAALLKQAQQLASTNRLFPDEYPADVIRKLMTAADGMTEVERRWAAEMPHDIELGAPPCPLQDGAGRVTTAHMAHLRKLEAAAAKEGRYEDALYLSRLQGVIDPRKPQLTYEDCAPEDPAAAAQFFLDNGFVIVRGALPPDRLARVQAAWERFAGPGREAWEEHRRHCGPTIKRHYHESVEDGWQQVARKWYGITDFDTSLPNKPRQTTPFIEMDEAFVDLIDNERVADVAERVLIGPPDGSLTSTGDTDAWRTNRGVLRCLGASPRTYPPDVDGAGYTYWHRDDQPPELWPYPTGRAIKMFMAMSDVEADGGPLAVVPGSFRLKYGPWETLRRSFQSSMTLDAELPQSTMPNHVRFTSRAGDALLFDHGTWHTAMPNTSRKERRVVIIGWSSSAVRWATPRGTGALLSEQHEKKLVASGRMTPLLRKLSAATFPA
eukprot:COSAG05_NODE_724_length_7726_cov_2.123771_3_plen_599_part_00